MYLTRKSLYGVCGHLRGRVRRYTFNYAHANLKTLDLSTLPHPTDWQRISPHDKLIVEIGTGHGELLEHLAKMNSLKIDGASSHLGGAFTPSSPAATPNPHLKGRTLIIGFELVSQFARKSARRVARFPNAQAFKAQAYEIIPKIFPKESIDETYILFPDPWHKKRHHKRRPLTAKWFDTLHKLTKPGGMVFFATDWMEYYEFVMNSINACTSAWKVETGTYTPEKFNLPQTHYYKKWVKAGREFKYIRLEKT